jgi:fructokinase
VEHDDQRAGRHHRHDAGVAELYGGIETGGSSTVCALGAGPDEIEAEKEFPTTSPDETIGRAVAFFAERPRPVAIGIGAFGPVDVDPDSATWGHVTTTPKPGWRHVSLAPEVRDRLHVPVAFDTDVNAAAIGEHRWGAGRDVESLCYLTVGTGVGAGLVLAGRAVHGLVHPEIGHLRIPHDATRDPFPGVCPIHGDCWEGLASAPAMAERWDTSPEDLPDDHPAWELEADYLALGLLAVVCVASPHRLVAGGGVMRRPGLLARVQRRLVELIGGYLPTPMLGERIGEYLVAPGLMPRSGVLGALALAGTATPLR